MARRGKAFGIEVLGLQEAVDAFRGLKEAFGATPLKECLLPIAEAIRDRAKVLVKRSNRPKAPGYLHLQDAIFAAKGKADLPSVIVGVDRKKAPAAHLVELGHGGPHPAPAHPFLRPAFAMFRRDAVTLVGKSIDEKIIKRFLRRNRRPFQRTR